MRDGVGSAANAWIIRGGWIGIVTLTLAAAIAPLALTGPILADSFMRVVLPVVFGGVGVSGMALTRFAILPGNLSHKALEKAPLARLVETGLLVAVYNSVACAGYGVVAAMMDDWWWLALPFGAMGAIQLAVNAAYVRSRAEELRREQQMTGAVS